MAVFRTTKGLFELNIMAFGLNNASATFQRFMDWILAPLKAKYSCYLHWYMDDVLIITPPDQKLHRQAVRDMLEIFK